MQSFNPSKIELSIKDNTKGHKIAAALYLVTDHLSDSDPLKSMLRTHAATLIDNTSFDSVYTLALYITKVMDVCVMARLISEKNASIIILELRHFTALLADGVDDMTSDLRAHFEQSETNNMGQSSLQSRTKSIGRLANKTISQESNTIESINKNTAQQQGIKSDRQEQILSLINTRKSAGIKDIATLFPETSEKTIQRELGALVASGRITKRGQKRWSVYMAVTA